MASPISAADSPSDRLVKLLPAEVTGLYVTVAGLCSASSAANLDKILAYSTIAISVIGLFYLYRVRQISNVLHFVTYFVSFYLWVLTLNAELVDTRFFQAKKMFPLIISIATVFWTFILPLIINGNAVASASANQKGAGS